MKVSPIKLVLIAVASAPAVFSACTGGLFLWVAVGTADVAEDADRFLALLAADSLHDAYASTSQAFRLEQDEQRFTSVISRLGVTGYELGPWRDRTLVTLGLMTLTGAVQAGGGASIPVVVQLVEEEGEWRPIALTGPRREGVGAGAWFRQRPSEEETLALIAETMADFDEAIRTRKFDDFYTNMSRAFKVEASAVRVQRAYQHFIDDEVDFSGLADVGPMIETGPELVRAGPTDVTVVSGRYPTEPDAVTFRFQYAYQHPDWKLDKIQIKLEPQDS